MIFSPEKVFVCQESWQDPVTREILARLPNAPVETVPSQESVAAMLNLTADPLGCGKRVLVLARHPGAFVNPCPGDGAEMCCNYRVANFASNCPMDCTYCVLQSFLENPALVVFTNIEGLIAELAALLAESPGRTLRIGTGDLSDSLALDPITGFTRRLVPLFGRFPNGVLELKTKSAAIANLEGLEHNGRTVVSWSVNTNRITRTEELRTASLRQRLAAARQCQEWGYPVGFHFDPMIYYPGWKEEYEETVREIFRSVDPEGIAWMSLGGFRFTARLREVVRRRFPGSRIMCGEFVPGHHGKYRYFRPIREELYSGMAASIRNRAPHVLVYLCMESHTLWRRCMDRVPRDAAELSSLLDRRLG